MTVHLGLPQNGSTAYHVKLTIAPNIVAQPGTNKAESTAGTCTVSRMASASQFENTATGAHLTFFSSLVRPSNAHGCLRQSRKCIRSERLLCIENFGGGRLEFSNSTELMTRVWHLAH
jgi:hypothetical protein